ncbi:MAG: hypothetical protein J0L57_05550 [Burkholderiales bacterium]|nr:hypothetical protein [Burkholderiales bacterium]
MIEEVAAVHACRRINHGPTVIASTAHGAQRNPMAAAWSMPVEFTPPRIAVVIDKSTWTRELLRAGGRWDFRADNLERHTLHHLGGGRLALPAAQLQARRLDAPQRRPA